MRKIVMAVLLGATALSAVALAQAPAPAPAPAGPAAQPGTPATPAADPVVARVNGLTISRSEVEQMRENLPPQYQQVPFEVLFPIILDRLIDMKLMSVAGRAERLGDDAEVRRRVAAYEDRVIGDIYMQRAITATVSEDAARASSGRSARRPAAQQIHAPPHPGWRRRPRRAASSRSCTRRRLRAISARARSIPAAGRTAAIWLVRRGRHGAEFFAAASHRRRRTSTEPGRTQFSWHVIKVEGRRTQTAIGDPLRRARGLRAGAGGDRRPGRPWRARRAVRGFNADARCARRAPLRGPQPGAPRPGPARRRGSAPPLRGESRPAAARKAGNPAGFRRAS